MRSVWCSCSELLVGNFLFFLYLTLKNEEVQNVIPIFFFSKGSGYIFIKFACYFFF